MNAQKTYQNTQGLNPAYRINDSGTFGDNTPEKRFSTGAIQATVWRNNLKSKNGDPVEYRTISFDRRYKDKEGNWQSTKTLRIADLPKAVVVLNKAFEYAVLKDTSSISGEYTV